MARDGNICLVLQGQFYDAILNGTKNTEFRDGTEYYDQRFFHTRNGEVLLDKNGKPIPKDIKTVTFINGYRRGARRMTYEVEHIDIYQECADGDIIEIPLNELEDDVPLQFQYDYAIHLGKRIT